MQLPRLLTEDEASALSTLTQVEITNDIKSKFRMNEGQSERYNKLAKVCEQKGWKLIGPYRSGRVDIMMMCTKGHLAPKQPGNIAHDCRVCAHKCPKAVQKRFMSLIEERNLKLASEYRTSDRNVTLECRECKYQFKPKPRDFMRDPWPGCKQCRGGTHAQILQRIKSNAAEYNWEILEELEPLNWEKTYKTKCTGCGDLVLRKITDLERAGCQKCAGHCPEEYKKRFVEEVKRRNWSFNDSDYINSKTNLPMTCDRGHTQPKMPESFMLGTACVICNLKQAAAQLFRILQQLTGQVLVEHKLIDFIQGTLSYDFYLPEYSLLIELDGRSHFDRKSRHFTESNRQRDILKTWIAKKHSRILRIEHSQLQRDDFQEIMKSVMNSTDCLILLPSEIYEDWIHAEPSEELKEKYYKLYKQPAICNPKKRKAETEL